jgi:hypothetical protein
MENIMQMICCSKNYVHFDIVKKFYACKETEKQNQRNDRHTTQPKSLKPSSTTKPRDTRYSPFPLLLPPSTTLNLDTTLACRQYACSAPNNMTRSKTLKKNTCWSELYKFMKHKKNARKTVIYPENFRTR